LIAIGLVSLYEGITNPCVMLRGSKLDKFPEYRPGEAAELLAWIRNAVAELERQRQAERETPRNFARAAMPC
jgi:hypothetical protein